MRRSSSWYTFSKYLLCSAEIAMIDGRRKKAFSLYSRAIGQDPEHAMAHCRRGISHHFRGHTERAESDLRTAMQLNPDIPNIQRYLKMAANGQGRR